MLNSVRWTVGEFMNLILLRFTFGLSGSNVTF